LFGGERGGKNKGEALISLGRKKKKSRLFSISSHSEVDIRERKGKILEKE